MLSEETKKKISETLKSKGIRPKAPMNWTGIKRGASPLKGRTRPKEVVEKIVESRKWYSHNEETRDKISKTLMGRFKGEKNPVWIKDRSKVKGRHQRSYHDNDYKIWRKEVCNRDNWKCRMSDEDCSGRLEVHHIIA